MLYRFLKFVLSYAMRKYFIQIEVLNQSNIPNDKPTLLLPNHRSAFMDPIVIATQLDRSTNFLVRGESFTNPILVKIFKRLKMIPIYRKEHDPDKVGQNKDIFKYCYELMEKSGCLMIFPEGICQTKHILAPIKTGAARIALEAEERNDFELGIHIIPVGINYLNPHRFRGNLTIDVGQPILLADYKNAYSDDPRKAVDDLTATIEEKLKERIIIEEDEELVENTEKIEKLLNAKAIETHFKGMTWLEKRKKILGILHAFKNTREKDYSVFQTVLNRYTDNLRRLGVLRNAGKLHHNHKDTQRFVIIQSIRLLLGFPIFIIGYLLHIVPFLLTRTVALKVVKRVDFMGSVVLILGLLIFSVFGSLETYIIYKYTQEWWITVLFFFLLPSLGLFAYHYLSKVMLWRDARVWLKIQSRKAKVIDVLQEDEDYLIQTLEGVQL